MKKLVPVLIYFLFGCTNSDQVDQLKKENDELREKLSELESNKANYQYQAFVVPSETRVLLGDTFYASVGLSAFDKTNPYTVVMGETDFENMTIIPEDTFKVSEEYGCALIKIPANKIGNFSYNGAVYQMIDGVQKEFLYQMTYTVTED